LNLDHTFGFVPKTLWKIIQQFVYIPADTKPQILPQASIWFQFIAVKRNIQKKKQAVHMMQMHKQLRTIMFRRTVG
jgi:hypothetical protein